MYTYIYTKLSRETKMKLSSPASYSKITQIHDAAVGAYQYNLVNSRALLFIHHISSTFSLTGITYETANGSTGNIALSVGINIIPVTFTKITVDSAGANSNTNLLRIFSLS